MHFDGWSHNNIAKLYINLAKKVYQFEEMEKTVINWGIIGLGRIAKKFADDLKRLPGARLHAVASTSLERARDFAAAFGARHAYGSYEDIAECPDLDVLYIATPHVLHAAGARIALEAGIPALVEKPFAMNAEEAFGVVALARNKNIFLMEALWTRFIPATIHALDLIRQGAIGEVHTVKADFGFKTPYDPHSRLFNPALGGGALLDIGIYPALCALMVFGAPLPEHIQSAATFTPDGVDDTCVFTFRYPEKCLAIGHATLNAHTPVEAWIFGTEGHIYLHPRWHHTQKITQARYEGKEQHQKIMEFAYEGWGYHFEAVHVMDCLRTGLSESPLLPLDFTLDLARTLDAIQQHFRG
jgi:predicted dehydrogenase